MTEAVAAVVAAVAAGKAVAAGEGDWKNNPAEGDRNSIAGGMNVAHLK